MSSIFSRLGWMVAGVLALFVISTLAGVVGAGPLDPPGAPGSTLQRLSDISPSWHQILPSNNGGGGGCNSTRFQCVLSDAAVLDHETGLVWQRTVAADGYTLGFALAGCEVIEIGGRYGWRLPTHQELRSLADTSPDHLPDGHPFLGVPTGSQDTFWSGSVFNTSTSALAWVLNFDAPADTMVIADTNVHRRWCVRGGPGVADVRQG